MTDAGCSGVQAQQRYRERRKQKFQEMEQTLQSLSGQVEEMHAVQTANAMLQVSLLSAGLL